MKNSLSEIFVKHTGKTLEEVTADCDRDFFMDAYEAKEYGLIDEVLARMIVLNYRTRSNQVTRQARRLIVVMSGR